MTLPKRDWMEMTWQDIAARGEASGAGSRCCRSPRWSSTGRTCRSASIRYIAEAYLARVRKHPARRRCRSRFCRCSASASRPSICRYPGTLTLSAATAIAAWTEIGESLARAGLRKLVLITSHGGNVAAMELVARDLRARLGMLAVTVGWHRFGYPDGTFSGEEKKHGIHGGDIETSLMLAAMPQTRCAWTRRRTRRRQPSRWRASSNGSAPIGRPALPG